MKGQFFIISAFLLSIAIFVIIIGMISFDIIPLESYEEEFVKNFDSQINKMYKIDKDFIEFVKNNTRFFINVSSNDTCYNLTLISSGRYHIFNCIKRPRIFIPVNVDCNDVEWYEILYAKENISERLKNIDSSNDFYTCKYVIFDNLYIYFRTYGKISPINFYNISIYSGSNIYNISIKNCTIILGGEYLKNICCNKYFIELSTNITNISGVEIFSNEDFCRLK